ncbi:winged helix-turn-helix domain-containing protein [Persephonella sp.]
MRTINRDQIKENTKELKNLLKKQKKKQLTFRVQMLILLKENPKMTLKEVSNLLPVSYSTLQRWCGYYKEGGLEKLLQWNVEGYKGKLSEEQLEELKEEIKTGRFSTQKEIIQWIYERFGVKYSQQGMSDLLRKLKVKKKTGRPVNIKKDYKQEEEFKKIFKEKVKENKDKDIFFLMNQDLD